MSDITARDLFLAVLCALVLARFLDMVFQATIYTLIRPHLEARAHARLAAKLQDDSKQAADYLDELAALRCNVGGPAGLPCTRPAGHEGTHAYHGVPMTADENAPDTRRDAISEMRAAMSDVAAIQEGAFLAGWRACEQCRQIATPTAEDHVLHHHTRRDAAAIEQKCARAGSGACNKLSPATGAICSRPPGHNGMHSHGSELWSDDVQVAPAVPFHAGTCPHNHPTRGLPCDRYIGHDGLHCNGSDTWPTAQEL